MQSFGSYIKSVRTQKGISLVDVAQKSGISHAHLSRIESSERAAPRPKTIKALSEVLGLRHEDLLVMAGHLDGPLSEEYENVSANQNLDEMMAEIALLREQVKHLKSAIHHLTQGW